MPASVEPVEGGVPAAGLHALSDFARGLALADTASAVAQCVLHLVPSVLDASFANLALLEPEHDHVVFIHPPSVPVEVAERFASLPLSARTPLTDAVRDTRTILLVELDEYRRNYPELVDDTVAAGLAATASVPLVADGQVLGALGVGWTLPIDDDTIGPRLQVVAELIAQTLRRTRVADERAQLVEELRAHLVPSKLGHPGLEIAVRYLAAESSISFGGDWYDLIDLDPGRLAVVVGDVAGHGIAAAATMAVLRTAVHAVVQLGVSLPDVYNSTEQLVAELGQGYVGTAVVAVLDTTHERLEYSSAGHPPLLLLRPGCPVEVLEDATRPVIGMGAQRPRSVSVPFPPGSVLVAYTDGLVERRREHIDVGIGRASTAFLHLAREQATCEQIADGLLAAAGDGCELRDDVALVVVRSP